MSRRTSIFALALSVLSILSEPFVSSASAQAVSNNLKLLQMGVQRPSGGAGPDPICFYDRAGVCQQLGTLPTNGGPIAIGPAQLAPLLAAANTWGQIQTFNAGLTVQNGNISLPNGNLTSAGTGQFAAFVVGNGTGATSKQLALQYDTTNNVATIISIFQGTAYTPLALNPNGTVTAPTPPVASNGTAVDTTANSQNRLSRVANAAALTTWTNYAFPVERDDLQGYKYTDTGASCAISGGDGGWQIQPATGHCWQTSIAVGAPITMWGAAVGGADIQPVLQKADVAINAIGGGTIIFPATATCFNLGTAYTFTSRVNIAIEARNSCINVSFASGDVLSFNGGKNINVTGLSFNHSVAHTSGNNLEVTGGARNFTLRNITCYANHYSCIGVDGGAAVGYIENIYVPGEGQVGICLGCETTGLAADLEITGGDFNYQHRSAIEMQSASGITLRQFNTDFNTHGLWIHPPSGQSVGAIDTDNTVYFDYSTQEGVLVDASAGTVSENRFEGETWATTCGAAVPAAFASSYSQPFTVTATAACVSLSGTAAFLINNDWNFQTFNAGGNGITLSGGTDNRVGGSVSQNGNNCTTANPCHGFAVGAGTSHWSWKGRAGGTNSNITVNGATNKQAYGVFNNGGSGSDYYSISGDLSGNVIGPLFDNGNGANKSYEGMWPPSPTQQGKNLLVDGNFTVNQRAYASGVSVAAGGLSFDHWFNPGTSATSYAFTAPATAENQASAAIDNVITIAAGGAIGQKVEERAVAGGEYALSCGGTASAAIVYVNNGNATVAATGTCGGAAIGGQVPVGATIQVQFAAPSGSTATLSTVELDYGAARAFERRPFLQDLQLCQRYFQIAPTGSGAWTSQASIFAYGVTFTVPMKSAPTASLLAAGTGVTDPGVANYAISAVNAGYTSLTATGGYIGLTTAVVPTARMPGIVQSNVLVGLSAEF